MNNFKIGKYIFAAIILISTLQTVAAVARDVQEVSIDAPDQQAVGEQFTVSADATGTGLTHISLEKKINGGWTVMRDHSCSGDSCQISEEDTIDSTGTVTYRVEAEAGDVDEKDASTTVEITEASDISVGWEIFPTDTKVGKEYLFKSEATDPAGKLGGKWVEIRYRTWNGADGWSSWKSLNTEYCSKYESETSACSVKTRFTPQSTKKHEFNTRVTEKYKGGTVYADRRAKYITPTRENRMPSVSLKSPADGATDLPRKPSFSWDGSDPDGDSLSYKLLIEKVDSTGETPWTLPDKTFPASSESFTITEKLSYDTKYVWGVKVKDQSGIWKRSDTVRTFTTKKKDTNAAVSSVLLISPSNGATVSPSPSFSFRADDPDGDNVDYQLRIARGSQSPWTSSDHTFTYYNKQEGQSFTAKPGITLTRGNSYTWGVKAKDDSGIWKRSRTRTFTVRTGTTSVADIIDEGPSGQVQNPVNLFVRLDRSGDSYRCYWDRDSDVNRKNQRMTQVTDRRFEKGVNFDQDRTIYFQCFRKTDGASTNTVSTSFHFPPDSSSAPKAGLEVSPTPADTGQTVKFDATGSTPNGGSITEYRFDIDGDGAYEVKNNQDGIVRRTFSSPRSRTARVKVFDSEDLSDTAKETYTVQESTTPSCNIDVGTLNVYPRDIDSGESTTTDITVFNNMDQVQTVKVRFEADGQSTTLTRDISSIGQRKFERSFTLDSDSEVTATVMTSGDICGSRTLSVISEGVNVRSGDTGDEGEATLDVDVEDETGEDLEDARVEVSNGDDEVDYTDENGDASFTLEPGDYEVEVSKNGYRTESQDLELDNGESEDLQFNLREDRDELRISAVSYNDNVCSGSDLRVQVIVENTMDSEQSVELSGSGLGSETRSSLSVPSDESRVKTLVFPNVQRESPGTQERFTIVMQNGESQKVTRTVNVQDCPVSREAGTATGISLDVSPQTVKSGEPVKVSGFVDGIRGRKEVDISVDGRTVANVNTAPDGYYQAFITPSGSGDKTLTVSADSERASRTVRVAPTASIDFVEAPGRVFQGETFQVCGRGIRSQVNARVFLIEDGEILEAKNGVGRVCFDVSEMDSGEHEYRVAAVAGNQRSVATKRVRVMEMKEEVRNFPDQIASVESSSGLVKVTLYNNHDSIKRYDLELSGVPEHWTSQSEKQAVLRPGQEREVFFYVTPEEEGQFNAELKVRQEGAVIHQQTVRISSGGTTKPGKSILERLLQRLRL